MAQTVDLLPSSATTRSPGIFAWTNAGNITADDGSYATTNGNSNTTLMLCCGTASINWASVLPPTATVVGIEVKVKASVGVAGTAPVFFNIVRLYVNAGAFRNDKNPTSTFLTTTLTEYSFGGASDLWGGGTLTGSQMQNITFGVQFAWDTGTNKLIQVDAYKMNVTYTYTGITGVSTITGISTITF